MENRNVFYYSGLALSDFSHHPHINCWWNGNGAEEVDAPRGSSVPSVRSLEGCKEVCLQEPSCEGILWQASKSKCFRKTALKPERCQIDKYFDLYLITTRVHPSPPPPPAPPSPPSPPPWPMGLPTRATFAHEMRFLPRVEVGGQWLPRLGGLLHVGLGMWNSRGINLVSSLRAMLGDATVYVETPQFTLRRLQLLHGVGTHSFQAAFDERIYRSSSGPDWGGLRLFGQLARQAHIYTLAPHAHSLTHVASRAQPHTHSLTRR